MKFRSLLVLLLCLCITTTNCLLNVSIAEESTPFTVISDKPVTLTIAVVQDSANGRPSEEVWLWKYFLEYHNIDFKVELILDTELEERRSLMFNTDSLPDIMLGLGVSANDYLKYGQEEGMLLAVGDYFNETDTPNILRLFENVVGSKEAVTLPNGKIYTTPTIGLLSNAFTYNNSAWWYNRTWFDELGLTRPEGVMSLDEMLNNLRSIKAAAGTGSIPENVIPLGGAQKAELPTWLPMQAFGLIGGSAPMDQVLVNGKPKIAVNDRERFPEFLEFMNTLYSEGLISPDFYTLDGSMVSGQKADGRFAVSSFIPAVMPNKEESGSKADWSDFWIMGPLSTQYNQTGDVAYMELRGLFSIGNFAASAKTADPSLVARFLDFWYSDFGTGIAANYSPSMDVENKYNLGMFTVEYNTEINNIQVIHADGTRSIDDFGSHFRVVQTMSLPGYQDNAELLKKAWGIDFERKYSNGYAGHDPFRDPALIDDNNLGRWGQIYNIFIQYTTLTPYPSPIYLSEGDIIRSSDLYTVLNEFVTSEVARFITGQRSLDSAEINKFYADLDVMGIKEYEDLYIKAFEPHMK